MILKNNFHIKDIIYNVDTQKLEFQFADGAVRYGIGIKTLEDVLEEISNVIIELQ